MADERIEIQKEMLTGHQKKMALVDTIVVYQAAGPGSLDMHRYGKEKVEYIRCNAGSDDEAMGFMVDYLSSLTDLDDYSISFLGDFDQKKLAGSLSRLGAVTPVYDECDWDEDGGDMRVKISTTPAPKGVQIPMRGEESSDCKEEVVQKAPQRKIVSWDQSQSGNMVIYKPVYE